MPKRAQAGDRHRLWIFGQSYDFYPVTIPEVPLAAANYSNTRHQKTQIVLHNTAGHGSAEQSITNWNTGSATGGPENCSANYIVERNFTQQANRPARTEDLADQADTQLVDAVRVIDEDLLSYHAGNPGNHPNYGLSLTSVGIEISNLGEELWHLNAHDEPSGIEGRHVPVSTCPKKTNTYSSLGWVCNHGRARDLNRWLRMSRTFEGVSEVQALDDEQYMTLTLLLRHLCVRHHIPRQFFGKSFGEIFKHWFYPPPIASPDEWAKLKPAQQATLQAQQRYNVSTVQNFRGILVHRNVHSSKICPGVVDRNRLFRGISDEWWLPVQPDGVLRPYYSGPFKKPEYVADTPTKNYYFRFTNAAKIEGSVLRDVNLDALLDTQSYYKTTEVDSYYSMVETRMGGVFPMGTNKVWHGGVHFGVTDSNPCVFAAACGTVMAARMTSNEDTDKYPGFGSQRFVLLKHAIFREMQADARGLNPHLNYDVVPKIVFSLYMHLGPVKDPTQEDDENPPWFNLWRRANPDDDIGMDGDKGKVFAPNIQVLLGDILGSADYFRGRRMIHFEVISHRNTELTDAPWDDANQRAVDETQDLICDVPTLENFLTARLHKSLQLVDPVDAAQLLRKSKALHKSEWALTSEAQVATLIPHPQRRTILWTHIKRFSWVTEAIAANPRLGTELGDANGMFWHYHPITFMQNMNELALTENRTPEETTNYTGTNVELSSDYYLTNFVNYRGNRYVPADADTKTIRVTEVSQAGWEYTFKRNEIACSQPGNHDPETTPPQSTRFSLALLGILEQIHQYINDTFKIALSHICNGHLQASLCVMNDDTAAANHNAGNAVDIQPAHATAGACKQLWNAVKAVIDPYNVEQPRYCGMPSQADLPAGFAGLSYTTTPRALEALTADPQENVPAGELPGFKIHIELLSAAAVAAIVAEKVNLRVTLMQLQVINAVNFFGQCDIKGFVNGNQVANHLADNAVMAQMMQLDWPVSVSLGQNDQLKFSVGLAAENPLNNDKISFSYSRTTNPAWGIGTWSGRSEGGSFMLYYKIEWDQGDF